MKYYESILDLVGSTPIVKLSNIKEELNLQANIFAKVEYFNPGGSVKDRIAKAMILDLLDKGIINQDTTIYEPTSGNTGIGAALVCAKLGLKLVIVMPENVSSERIKLIKAYGSKVILTDKDLGMQGSIDEVSRLLKTDKNSVTLSQFENKVNPLIHYNTTALEIVDTMDNNIDYFVAGVGTGGTLSGVGNYLKEHIANVKVVAVEPSSSPVLSKSVSGSHKITGIGAGFVPNTLDINVYDKIICVDDQDAFKYAKMAAKKEGLLVGISSGATLTAAIEIAKKVENKDKNIVVIFPDNGERYLSIKEFTDEDN